MIEGLTVITLFILLRLCVCHVNCLCLCDYLTIWGGMCDGQMPFPPEILAPPADRVKKEKKPKTPKNKKETAGKVREDKGE